MSGELAHHASITIGEALSGLFFGTAFGVGFGVLFSQIKFLGSVITAVSYTHLDVYKRQTMDCGFLPQ